MAAVADRVGAGFVESRARPGGNITGITFFAHERAASRVRAVAVIEEAARNAQAAPIPALALRHRLPSIGTQAYCDAGGLVGYGADFAAMFHRTASLVDRILRGASPAELPVERPTRFELAVNERTARALGATLPRSLLIQADSTVR